MRAFILRALESLSGIGFLLTVLAFGIGGWQIGLLGSPFIGLLAGLMLGVIAGSTIFGLALLALGIYRNTSQLMLYQRLGPEAAEQAVRAGRAATGFLGLGAAQLTKVAVNGYLLLFFAYMFLPLVFMVLAAFNTSAIPTAVPMKGFTLDWFGDLFADVPLWASVVNSVIIGIGVVALSLSLGLAGALLLTRLRSRGRTFLYAVLVSPLLTPGIILGISTLVFWNSLAVGGGLFLAMLAQSTFIAAYCMLLFLARLQRFDFTLEEAALDLGATQRQVFRKITMPFLKPAILSGGMLAFLQSFENFNTTVFAIGTDTTLTILLASKTRLGLTPEVNALGVIFIVMTICIAVVIELKRRAEKHREEVLRERAKRADTIMAAQLAAAAPARDDRLPAGASAAPAE